LVQLHQACCDGVTLQERHAACDMGTAQHSSFFCWQSGLDSKRDPKSWNTAADKKCPTALSPLVRTHFRGNLPMAVPQEHWRYHLKLSKDAPDAFIFPLFYLA